MTAMVEKTTGAVTIAVGGITATLGHEDVAAWGSVLMSLAPLLLILFLIWRIHKLDQQHRDCQKRHEALQQSQQKMQEQLLTTFLAVKSPSIRKELPTVEEFKSNAFSVPSH
jgi:hypothetical protein